MTSNRITETCTDIRNREFLAASRVYTAEGRFEEAWDALWQLRLGPVFRMQLWRDYAIDYLWVRLLRILQRLGL